MKSTNQSTLADVARRAGVDAEVAEKIVEALLEEAKLGRKVWIRSLGIFRVTHTKAREHATPLVPGGIAKIPARCVLRFRSSEAAQEFLNRGQA